MKQIKYIALDIDGTLVNDAKQFAPNTENVFRQLFDLGITLIFCSGRQIYALLNDFKQYKNHSIYIGENGGISYYDNDIHIHAKLEQSHIDTVLQRLSNNPEITPVLSGLDVAYVPKHCTEKFINEILPYYPFNTIKDSQNVDDIVLKVAAHVNTDSYHKIFVPNQDLNSIMDVCVSADQWCDFNPKGSSKGATLTQLMKELNIAKEEVMAVGDSGNDASMLAAVGHPVAMKNAIDSIKSMAVDITSKDNNEFGCIDYLINYFHLDQ